ncbi:UvrD-helicase domain-containing protein [Flavobacterium sp. N1719]|uniref:UvrD-helicase domain-containing protein n=1 Tax=Flavobacterium sp. N1719 TaxID=2885633 RepID=UPI00222133F7|nr:UvrD-helicase domain-containing protein [Flavobacterium sp. N1719]
MRTTAFSLYDASAGSGKTYTLVKEYLKIILLSPKPDAYRHILAITFTNKAVHEMKSRVVESLSQFASETPSEKAMDFMQDVARDTGLSLAAIQEKARLIIKHLIHNYAAFDISTIDKFTHKVIRAFAHDLNLPITFEVSLDTDSLLTEAIDAIIAQAGEDETLTQLLVNYTMEKTDDDKSWDISKDIFETGRLLLNENNREEILQLQEKSIQDFVVLKNKLIELTASLESEAIATAQAILDFMEGHGVDLKSFKGSYFPNHLKSIVANKYNPSNKSYREPEAIVINKTAKDGTLIESLLPEIMAMLQTLYACLDKQLFYTAFLKNVTPLSLLNTLQKKLQALQEEQNILSIAEFNKLIHEQIQHQPAPFIYEKLGEKYRHFFIDEFQDTSELQWKNLIPLIDNALAGEENGIAGSLLLVGDPKQSIYRWRGGKAEQFIALGKGENPFSNKDFARKTLETNYRSYSEIIEFNNDFFQFLSGKFDNEDYKNLYEQYSSQKTTAKKGGFVSFEFLPVVPKNEQDEDTLDKADHYLQSVVNTIASIRNQGFAYRDIAILIRNNRHGALLAQFLTEQGLPIVSSESLMLAASGEVRVLIAVLRYLNNPSDLEAKAQFSYYLAKNSFPESIHDFIANGMAMKQESLWEHHLKTSLGPKWASFSFQNLRKKALFDAVEYLSELIIPVEKHNAYLQYFQDVVLEQDLRKQMGLSDFLNFWDNHAHKLSISSPEGNDAIRIMTIHKSKGLEFPVVLFPFAEENLSLSKGDKMWLDTNEDEIGISKALVAKKNEVEGYNAEAAVVYNQRKQEDLLDTINVLYVALTRAVEQLYVISANNRTTKGELRNNLSSFFIEFLENNGHTIDTGPVFFGNPQRISKPEVQGRSSQIIPKVVQKFDPKNIKIAQRESLMWNTHQQEAIAYGNLVHEIMAKIKVVSDVEWALQRSLEEGLIHGDQLVPIQTTVESLVFHEELTDFFKTHAKVYNEQTLLLEHGPVLKPDRVVINAQNQAYLLDYKTGTHQEKYRKQLDGYAQALEAMGFKVMKKTLVYIGEQVEIVHLH